ncbi:MAG: hypothetical protein IH584_04960, partial [Candidatus Aminicenantes bacterium]|nr:hypothetical protein [Candidatus Aminicenantes bacterium]
MKKSAVLFLLLAGIVLFSSCAPGPNKLAKTANSEGDVAGFWMGLW